MLGTPLYMAPELVCHQKYNEKVDIWSLGIITYQLLSGLTPFDANRMEDINNNIVNKEVSFKSTGWRNVSKAAKNFIQQCLMKNPKFRPSIDELFKHPWICDVPEEENEEAVALNIQENLIKYQYCSQF